MSGSTGETLDRRDRVLAAAILTVALALRLAHVLTIRDYPLFDVLSLDSESYDRWARAIAGGELARGRPFYQAPLYAYFLAALHSVSGGDLLLPRVVNAILGTVHVGLVMHLGRRTFGTRVGLLAAALVALHGTFLFEEGKVMKTTLGVTLATATLVLLVEGRRRGGTGWWAAAGLAGALATLVRENFLLFLLAVAAWLAWRTRDRGGRPALALAAGLIVGLAPATLHNLSYEAELIPVTSQAGQNFYTGVHPGNPHGGYLVPDFVRRSPRFEEKDFAAEAERRAGRELTPGETSRYWLEEGLRVVGEDPARFAGLFFRKLGLLYHDFEIPDDEDVRFFRRYAPVLRLPLPGFGVLAVLGLLGLVLALRERNAPPELTIFLVVYSLSVALFFVFSRYRLPLVAPLAVLGAHAAVTLGEEFRARRFRSLAAPALITVVLSVILFRPPGATPTFANSHLSMGIAFEVQDRPEEALAQYREGLALEPEHAKLRRRAARLLFDEGVELGRAGRLAEAAEAFEEVVRLGEEPPGIHANLALAYEALGREKDAVSAARKALDADPGDRSMREMIGRLGGED